MTLTQGWFPPSRENWQLLFNAWQLFPLVTALQWVVKWHPRGKTSIESRLNLPGKLGWATMEAPGFVVLLYVMRTLPGELGIRRLPWQNWAMAGMYTIHYIYRSFLHPYLNPTMSPIHFVPWSMAVGFQIINGLSLGGWLGGHGPVTDRDWAGRTPLVDVGLFIWGAGLLANMYHDDRLRAIRRAAARRQEVETSGSKGSNDKAKIEEDQISKGEAKGEVKRDKSGQGVEKVYMLPEGGLFQFVLYAHYLCEWIEWTGFWIVGGLGCGPARVFLLNSVANMLPRAVQGRDWYIEKFGRKAVGARKAVFPGLL